MKASEILKVKGPEVITIGEDKTLFNATEIMVNNRIGMLLVLNSEAKMAGVLSERDIVRIAHKMPDSWHTQSVKDHMTKKVIVCEADDDLEYVENIMTNNHIRHLPVLSNKILIGLISIGDIVKAQLHQNRTENKYLMDYISGNVK
jgi:CBS domain-containing protein